MDYELLCNLIHKLPLGYVYYKAGEYKQDLNGKPVILDANEAFNKIFGISGQSVIGKRMAEDVLETEIRNYNWMISHNKVLDNEPVNGYSQITELRGRLYKTLSFSPERNYFITVFQDITSEIKGIQALKTQKIELEKASNELETIFNGTQDALFLIEYKNGEFRYIRNNTAHQKISGFRLQDIAGRSPVEVMGKEFGEVLCSHYKKCIAEGKAITYEQELPFPTGKKVWKTSLTPFFENGKITHLVGSGEDITELRKLQKDKENLLRRLQSMFREHAAVMLIIDPETGRILDVNPAACRFYGYTGDELLALRIHDLNSSPYEEVEKYLADTVGRHRQYSLFPHRLKNGEIRLVDAYSSPVSYNGHTVLFSIIFDVSDREKYKEDLYLEKELLSKTLNSIGDGVVTTNNEGVITSLNKAAREITGWGTEDAKNRQFSDIFQLESEVTGNRILEDPVAKVLRRGKLVGLANHTVLINRQGNPVPIADSAAPIKDEDGKTFGVVMVFRDVSKEKERNRQILYLSYHDPLTGLYNRRFIEEEMLRLHGENQYPFTLIMGDVNGLKITNDVFGHKTGDKLLQKVAQTLTASCRNEDIISRWGGDEFLILMPHATAGAAEQTIKKIKDGLNEQSEEMLKLSVAFGCAEMNESNELQQVLQRAEEWMYHQKLLEGKSYKNTIINALLCTLYEKSLETEKHDERLKGYCQAVGKELNLGVEELNELSLLALLHDIGKVGIRQNILQKPGPLTPEEWQEMKKHPEIGYRIAQNIPELSIVSEYILSHHERWDGKGYPNGLAGKNIPLLCRILAVVDAYDAMTNDRAYRKAIGKEKAIAELKRNAGTQFDSYIVDLFIRLISDKQNAPC